MTDEEQAEAVVNGLTPWQPGDVAIVRSGPSLVRGRVTLVTPLSDNDRWWVAKGYHYEDWAYESDLERPH